jgi:hypothetical protein
MEFIISTLTSLSQRHAASVLRLLHSHTDHCDDSPTICRRKRQHDGVVTIGGKHMFQRCGLNVAHPDERAVAFTEVARPDSSPFNFVLATPDGRTVDVHSHMLSSDGRNIGGIGHVAADLTGSGLIGDTVVRCIALPSVVRFHTGYEPREEDWHDMRLLADGFGVSRPAPFNEVKNC